MEFDLKTPMETSSAPEENSAYFDALDNSEQDLEDIKKSKEKKATKGDVVYLSVVSGLILAVIVFMAVWMNKTGRSDPVSFLRKASVGQESTTAASEGSTESELGFFNAVTAFSGNLKGSTGGTQFPNGIQSSFRALYAANNDVVGWIRINGTSIDYPVLQGNENTNAEPEYERRNFYGEKDHRGSIWMDYRNRVAPGANGLSKVTVIYGHHLTSDECIFAELENYMDVEYYKTHPIIEMNTIYKNYKWKIFACMVTNVDEKDDNGHMFYYWDPYVSDEDTQAFANEVISRSYFKTPDVDIVSSDKLLCLSTCTYIMNKYSYKEMRCVIMARLVRDGESETVDVSKAVDNPGRRMPQYWYTLNGTQNPYVNIPVFGEE